MKRFAVAIYILILCLGVVACSSSDTIAHNSIKDIDTGKTFSLGNKKSAFDEAYGEPIFDSEKEEYSYLDGIIIVKFNNDQATFISCSGRTNRFQFKDFNFDMNIKDVEGRYEKSTTAGYIFYHRKYNDKGETVSEYSETAVTASLMVRDGDNLSYKDGEFIKYYIGIPEYVDKYKSLPNASGVQ